MDISKEYTINLSLSKADIQAYLDKVNKPYISAEKAKEYYKTLCFMYNDDENNTCQGIVTAENLAEKLHIDITATRELLNAMVYYGITERQGGGYVI